MSTPSADTYHVLKSSMTSISISSLVIIPLYPDSILFLFPHLLHIITNPSKCSTPSHFLSHYVLPPSSFRRSFEMQSEALVAYSIVQPSVKYSFHILDR